MEILANDVQQALKDANVFDAFTTLPPSHQREYITWIEDAKKPNTRAARIQNMCAMIAKKSAK